MMVKIKRFTRTRHEPHTIRRDPSKWRPKSPGCKIARRLPKIYVAKLTTARATASVHAELVKKSPAVRASDGRMEKNSAPNSRCLSKRRFGPP